MVFESEDIRGIIDAHTIAIYGAGLMGKTLLKCLGSKTYNKKIDSFIVRDKEKNPDNIEGVEVVSIEEAGKYKKELVLVALHEKHICSALAELRKKGFQRLLPVSFDSDLWTDLRANWMRDERIGFDENTPIISSIGIQTNIFVVHSNSDKCLKEKIEDRDFENSILVGATFSKNSAYRYRDDVGENISEKNKEFCELTALYWIWKNDASKSVGLSHYRRRFLINQDKNKTEVAGVDVIVTVPIININTVREQYALDHNIEDWNIMMEAIRTLYPEYYESAVQVQSGLFYYAYNMCITRREIMDEYCEWLFSILSYCEKQKEIDLDCYQRRYAGFLAERLLTIFLVHNKQYKIGIALKHFIESE